MQSQLAGRLGHHRHSPSTAYRRRAGPCSSGGRTRSSRRPGWRTRSSPGRNCACPACRSWRQSFQRPVGAGRRIGGFNPHCLGSGLCKMVTRAVYIQPATLFPPDDAPSSPASSRRSPRGRRRQVRSCEARGGEGRVRGMARVDRVEDEKNSNWVFPWAQWRLYAPYCLALPGSPT